MVGQPKLAYDARDPVDLHVGQRVKVRRMMCGVSQKDLAAYIRVSVAQQEKYEAGTNRISAGRLWHISQALRCKPNWFYEDMPIDDAESAPLQTTRKPRKSFRLDQETWAVVRYYESMPESLRDATRRYLKQLSEIASKYSRKPKMDELPDREPQEPQKGARADNTNGPMSSRNPADE
jgi:transcriptional regulator with XRE-family HTH domain